MQHPLTNYVTYVVCDRGNLEFYQYSIYVHADSWYDKKLEWCYMTFGKSVNMMEYSMACVPNEHWTYNFTQRIILLRSDFELNVFNLKWG